MTVQVEEVCNQFDAAWKSGQRPVLETYLSMVAEAQREPLLRELLLLDFEHRHQVGERPTPEDYCSRLPRYTELIDRLLAARLPSASSETETVILSPPFDAHQSFSTVPPRESSEANLTEHDMPYTALLGRTWPFSELPSAVLQPVFERMREVDFAPGEILIHQGEPSRHLMVLAQGVAQVLVQDDKGTHEVAQVEGAMVLGEMGLLTDEPCTATVKARTPVRALALSAEQFHKLAARHQVLWGALSRLIARRLGWSSRDVLEGKVFEGYRILRCVGRGGMAVVYEAESVAERRPVALKMMSHRFAHDLEAQGRFEREVQICQSLRHPNICRVYESFTAFGTNFMVMEFCQGVTLTQVIESYGPLPEDQIRRILGQLARALAYAHGNGVLHRDLKPANIMLDQTGTLKLMDFGLAKSAQSIGLTSLSHVLGTPRYMPPERLSGGPADARADIFAFGCITYEMITGEPLFPGNDWTAILRNQFQFVLPEPERIRRGLNPDLYHVLRCSLDMDPNRRALALGELAPWCGNVDQDLLRVVRSRGGHGIEDTTPLD